VYRRRVKRTWTASVFCQFEHRLALARRVDTGQWEPLSTRIKRGELPVDAAVRVVETEFGLDVHLPPVHQLMGAPDGLLLYSEYPISVEETRLSLLFLGELETDDVRLGKEYDDVMWTHSDQKLPRDILPQVRAAFPFAVMAAGLVHGTH
jgi:ADP-ribose pyrophosphatase YjhB (NUDIX family)